jgi:hypothetical protein
MHKINQRSITLSLRFEIFVRQKKLEWRVEKEELRAVAPLSIHKLVKYERENE